MAMRLFLDLETFSDISLKDCGVYKYAASPEFEILLFAYALNDGPVRCVDLANGEEIPQQIIDYLHDPMVEKWAHNAQFERVCLSQYYGKISPVQWYCTSVKALTLGLPPGLDAVGRVLKLKEDKQKLFTGKNLIRKFSIPQKPSKANGMKTRYYREDLPTEWEDFKTYCIRDVETEREIHKKLDRYPTEKEETKMYWLDQVINDRGVGIEEKLVNSAIQINEELSNRLKSRFIALTGVDNPNSLQQLKGWIKDRSGEDIQSITKETIPQIKADLAAYPDILEALSIRQQLGKSSIAKYQKMLDMLLPDKRVKGILQFYGGSATGRWAGRGVQVQNLPQNKIKDLDTAREAVLTADLDTVEMLFDNVPSILSQLIRTAFVPREGHRYIIADFNAIEGRVLPWLADEDWRNELFASGGKLYETSAARMFNVPVERIKPGNPEYALRAKGKVAELALGYQGSVGAMITMGALKQGLLESELPPIVEQWRAQSPNIVKFWKTCENAAKEAVRDRTTVIIPHGIQFIYEPGILFIQLPSKRKIAYFKPKLEQGDMGLKITYEGRDDGVIGGEGKRLETYGGKICENIVQATARDALRDALLRVEEAGYKTVMHIHDEIVIEHPEGEGSLQEVLDIMADPLPWASGLILRGAGFEANYYQKD